MPSVNPLTGPWPLARRLMMVILCMALSACANLQGLRDYAQSSRQLSEGPELVRRWQQSEQVLQSQQALFDATIAPRRTPEVQAMAQRQARQVLEIQRVLAAYFKTVGEAWDDLDPAFEAADRKALMSLGRVLSLPLDAYRHRAVLRLVRSQHQPVSQLLATMEKVALLMAQDLQAEADAARVPYLQLLGETSQPALRFLVRERMEARRLQHDLPLQEAWRRHALAWRAVRQAHERLSQVDDLRQGQRHAQALAEAIERVRESQSAWAALRPR